MERGGGGEGKGNARSNILEKKRCMYVFVQVPKKKSARDSKVGEREAGVLAESNAFDSEPGQTNDFEIRESCPATKNDGDGEDNSNNPFSNKASSEPELDEIPAGEDSSSLPSLSCETAKPSSDDEEACSSPQTKGRLKRGDRATAAVREENNDTPFDEDDINDDDGLQDEYQCGNFILFLLEACDSSPPPPKKNRSNTVHG